MKAIVEVANVFDHGMITYYCSQEHSRRRRAAFNVTNYRVDDPTRTPEEGYLVVGSCEKHLVTILNAWHAQEIAEQLAAIKAKRAEAQA